MAKRQSTHRQNLEEKHLDAGIGSDRRGQILGFVLAAICLVGGLGLIAMDKSLQGFGVLIPTVAALGTLYYRQTRSQAAELREKISELDTALEQATGEPRQLPQSHDTASND